MNVITLPNRRPLLVAVACVVAALLMLAQPAAADDLDDVVLGNRHFALDLFHQLSDKADVDENLLYSPYSISTALAMTYAGARGQTASEMAQTLHFSLPDERLHGAMGELIGQLNGRSSDDYRLEVANRLWGQTGSEFRSEFLQTAQNHYEAGLASVDFANDADAARQTINHWVEERTENKIQNLLPEGSVTRDTQLVLTNAVYLLADWEKPFAQEATHPATFHVPTGDTVEVAMMSQTDLFNYAEAGGVQMLEMGYEGDELSMLLMLPAEDLGDDDFAAWLTSESLEENLSQLESARIQVEIPKFRVTADMSLTETLGEMGMPTAFTAGADFSGISDEMDLSITEVRHKAFIDVDEKGTEAAAATGVVVGRTSAPPPPIAVFHADRPFAFMLRDNETGSILFMGQVNRPESPPGAPIPEPATSALLLAAVAMIIIASLTRGWFTRNCPISADAAPRRVTRCRR